MSIATQTVSISSLSILPPEVFLEVSRSLSSEQLYLLFEIAMSCSATGQKNANLLRCRRIVMLDVVQREDDNSLKQSLEKPGNFFDRFLLLIQVASSTEKAIRTLNFSSYALSDENVTQISALCPQLNKLVIGNQEKGSLSRDCFEKLPQNLETLILTHISFKAEDLLKLPPNLIHLSFQNCSLVSGNFTAVSSPNCMLFEDLEELGWNQGSEELFLFFYGHKKLHTLTFLPPKNFQYEITEEWLKQFPCLKKLTTQLDLIDKGIWQSISPSLIETLIIHSDEYCGAIYEGKRHGQGISYSSDGTKEYEGQWQDDKPHGYGVFYHLNGTKEYEGQWQYGKPHGQGIGYRSDGRKFYEGLWQDGKLHGQGIGYHSDGAKDYEGFWHNGKRHGQGISYYFDNIKAYENLWPGIIYCPKERKKYSGQWQNGKHHGQGISYHPIGTKDYEGQWQGDRHHGQGISYYSDGTKNYAGQWQEDERHGQGTSYRFGGLKEYKGQWQGGKRHGQGINYRLDGTKDYEGQWQYGKPHGQGASYYLDNTKFYEDLWSGILYRPVERKKYSGQWQNGKVHGQGISYHFDGTKDYEGLWQNGKPYSQNISSHLDSSQSYEGLRENGSFQNQMSFTTMFKAIFQIKNSLFIFDNIFNFFKNMFTQMSNWFSQNRN